MKEMEKKGPKVRMVFNPGYYTVKKMNPQGKEGCP